MREVSIFDVDCDVVRVTDNAEEGLVALLCEEQIGSDIYEASVLLTPKDARKLARAIKKAAKHAKASR